MVFDDESRATLIPQAYGPGAIIEGRDTPTPRTLPAVDPAAKTVALGPQDVVVPSDLHFPQISRIGHYDVLGEIARGGMGVVYRARDTKLNRLVAVKVLLEGKHASSETVERFLREAQSTARLRHPAIVPIYDMGVHEGRNYLVMEYVVGQPLSALVHSRDMTPQRAVDLMIQVADAVEHAHREGIVHRDLKPANILVDTEWRGKVTDFGLAKQGKAGSDLTKSGTAMGTPYYMPPEQARGEMRQVDARSDVYAMGAVLYECLCGQPPLIGENDIDTIIKVVNEEPVAPSVKKPALPKDLDPVCLKCLEKDPARRYQSARELADELRRFRSGEGVLARGSGPISKVMRSARRHRALLAAGFVGFAAAVTLFGILRLGRDARRKSAAVTPAPEIQVRPNVAFYEPRSVEWAGEGWSLTTEGGDEAWSVFGTSPRTLTATGAHDGSLRLFFNLLADRSHPGTVSVKMFGNPARPDEGYVVRISRSGSSLVVEASRQDAAGRKVSSGTVRADRRWVPVLIERRVDGLWVRAGGSGVPVAALLDAEPGFRRDNRQVSLTVSGGSARVGGLTLETESAAYRRSSVGVGDRLFEAQSWEAAREQYRFAIPDSPTIDLDWEAVYKAALCDGLLAGIQKDAAMWKQSADGLARFLRGARSPVSEWPARQALAVAVAQLDNARDYVDVLPVTAGLTASRHQTVNAYRPAESTEKLGNLFKLLQLPGADDVEPSVLAAAVLRETGACPERPDAHCARLFRALMESFYARGMNADAERVAGECVALADDLLARQREARNRKLPDSEEITRAMQKYGTSAEMEDLKRRAREIQVRSMAAGGRSMEAVKLLDGWIDAASGKGDVGTRGLLMLLKADLLRLSGAPEGACAVYRQLAGWENELYSIPAVQQLSRTLTTLGKLDEAGSLLDASEKKLPRAAGIFEYERGFLNLARGDREKARADFLRVATGDADAMLTEAARFVTGSSSKQELAFAVSFIPTAPALVEFYGAIAAELAGKDTEALNGYLRAEALSMGRETPYWVARQRRQALEARGVPR